MTVQALIECISAFAANDSNPVLTVLPDSDTIKYDHKYPEPILSFAGAALRAYYHCHSWSSSPTAEHGHFHIFIRLPDENWTHLAGLSMDKHGQPLQWFTVNHWVTGEHWKEAGEIMAGLDMVQVSDSWMLVEKWLWQMINFYRLTLEALLAERDAHVKRLMLYKEWEDIMQDRNIYILSARDIDLYEDIRLHSERLAES